MSVTRVLTLANGIQTEVVPATTSSGVETAGQLVALNTNGVLDSSCIAGGIFPVLDVSVGDGTNTTFQTVANAFTTIILPIVATDTAGGYNTVASQYTIPITGTYLIVSKLRFADRLTSTPGVGVSFGQGVHTSNVDGSWFSWAVTTVASQQGDTRQGHLNTRIARFTAGSRINMYAYYDLGGSTGDIVAASLNVCLLCVG
jgi:hypothetical protein